MHACMHHARMLAPPSPPAATAAARCCPPPPRAPRRHARPPAAGRHGALQQAQAGMHSQAACCMPHKEAGAALRVCCAPITGAMQDTLGMSQPNRCPTPRNDRQGGREGGAHACRAHRMGCKQWLRGSITGWMPSEMKRVSSHGHAQTCLVQVSWVGSNARIHSDAWASHTASFSAWPPHRITLHTAPKKACCPPAPPITAVVGKRRVQSSSLSSRRSLASASSGSVSAAPPAPASTAARSR